MALSSPITAPSLLDAENNKVEDVEDHLFSKSDYEKVKQNFLNQIDQEEKKEKVLSKKDFLKLFK